MTVVLTHAARDRVLGALTEMRADMIEAATSIAIELAARDGSTCMPRVLKAMRERGFAYRLDNTDPRWSGAVLLPSRGWEKTGVYVPEGSRARPVPLWRRA